MSFSLVPAGMVFSERLNSLRSVPVISSSVGAGMFTALICTVPTTADFPTNPAAMSNLSGDTVSDGSAATVSVMSSAPRGAITTAPADVEMPVMLTVPDGTAFPMSDVPPNMRILPSPVASVTVGCCIPSLNVAPSSTPVMVAFSIFTSLLTYVFGLAFTAASVTATGSAVLPSDTTLPSVEDAGTNDMAPKNDVMLPIKPVSLSPALYDDARYW